MALRAGSLGGIAFLAEGAWGGVEGFERRSLASCSARRAITVVVSLAPLVVLELVFGMALKAEKFAEKPVELEAEMSQDELAQLRAAIAESDAQIARGEVVPAEALLEDIDRIFSER